MLGELLSYEHDLKNKVTSDTVIGLSRYSISLMQKSIPKLEALGWDISSVYNVYEINKNISYAWLIKHEWLSYFLAHYKKGKPL